jgi:hypothetical protein
MSKKQMSDSVKVVWFIWLQGIKNAPEICKACLNSWIEKNPSWEVKVIDENNIGQFVDKKTLNKFQKLSPIQCYCDAIKLYILYRYGGLYVDATIFCNKPLDNWLHDNLYKGIFVQWDIDSHLPSINFMYCDAKENNYMKLEYNEEDLKLAEGKSSYHKINIMWSSKILSSIKDHLMVIQIGETSNRRKKGVKIIANKFDLMNEDVDDSFKEAIQIYPYFKLTHKYRGKLKSLSTKFKQSSKLMYLLNN